MATTYGSSSFSASGVTLETIRQNNDPNSGGLVFEYVYSGTSSGIDALAVALVSQGVRVQNTSSAGNYGLVATFIGRSKDDSPGSETPNDSWGFDTQGRSVSVWSHPLVAQAATAFGDEAAFRKGVENALADGKKVTWGDIRDKVFLSLSRGLIDYETRQPILRRTRTFSAEYSDKNVIEEEQTAWTTSSLVSLFAVPSDVSTRLPANPSVTPSLTQWAWRLTVDTSEYSVALRRWVETKQWIFEAVDETWYNIV